MAHLSSATLGGTALGHVGHSHPEELVAPAWYIDSNSLRNC